MSERTARPLRLVENRLRPITQTCETDRSRRETASRANFLSRDEGYSQDHVSDPENKPEPEEDIPLERLYTRFAPYSAAIASRILGREGEVEDVVQDVFAAAVTGLLIRRNEYEVRGWLAKVTVRLSLRKLRTRRFWKFFYLDEASHNEQLADPTAGPFEQQLISEVYRALDDLGVEDRVAWVLRFVEGESLKEAADLCSCSLSTFKRRISRAHTAVEKHLSGSQVSRLSWETRAVSELHA